MGVIITLVRTIPIIAFQTTVWLTIITILKNINKLRPLRTYTCTSTI